MIRFAGLIAWRHLRNGGNQTLLIMAGVTMAVMLVIFISGLIAGVQQRILASIAGSIPHITIHARDLAPHVPAAAPGGGPGQVYARVQPRPYQRAALDHWRDLERDLRAFPHVVTVSPGVSDQGIASFGGKTASVRVLGALPAEQEKISNLNKSVVAGDFLALGQDQAVIGVKLAKTLGIAAGDRLRLTTAAGTVRALRVTTIVNTGQNAIDDGWLFVTLRTGQSLSDTPNAVTSFSVTLDDLFAADRVADAIAGALDVKADSWMRQNTDTLNGLRAQSASSLIISVFSLLAAAFAISSVLIVSVLKRSREIGILKAIGARSRFILLVFTLEGLSIAAIGSLLGTGLGVGVLLALRQIPQPVRVAGQAPQPLLPSSISAELILVTIGAALLSAVVASVFPAREAAKLDPVEVIRRG